MLHSSDAEDWLKRGLCEAILVLCKSGLKFQSQFSINGLLAITVDQREVFLINIKETVGHSPGSLAFDEESDVHQELGVTVDYSTINNNARCSNSSRKVSYKRKCSDKISGRSLRNEAEHAEVTGLQVHHSQPVNNVCPRGGDIAEENAGDFEGNSRGLYVNENLISPGTSHEGRDCGQMEPKLEDDLQPRNECPEFDLSLVKVEKEDEPLMTSDVHLQQSFHSGNIQVQFYNPWPSPHSLVTQNALHSTPSRPRGRRSTHFEAPNSMIGQQLGRQMIKNSPQQHSTQRRVAREGRCENCGTMNTTAWRRSDLKELLCNACGCYYKLHKYHRPLHMAHNEIKTRCRRNKQLDALKAADQSCQGIAVGRGVKPEISEQFLMGLVPS